MEFRSLVITNAWKSRTRAALWICLLGLSVAARGASVETVPYSQDFQSGELPRNKWVPLPPPLYQYWQTQPWSFTTNGTARTDIAYDETDSETQWVPDFVVLPQSSTGSDRRRGQFHACDRSGTLRSNGINLDRATSLNVTFFIYEAASSNGTYSLVSSDTVAAAAGSGTVRSSNVDVPVEAGKYYLIGAGWDADATYTYKGSGYHPSSSPLGHSLGGYAATGSAPPASLTGSWSTTAYPQELTFSDNAVARMDSSLNNSMATNSMDLAVNLAGYTEITLEFRHRESSDEPHAGDAIFLSDDSGANFTKVHDLDVANNAWQTTSLELFSLAINNGLSPNENFVIRFQQVDNYSWPSDGREFDDIKLFSKPDLDVYYLGVANEYLWKGFNAVKQVPISASVNKRGGESDLSAPTVQFRYGFMDEAPYAIQDFEYTTSAWDIPAMERSAESVSHTLTIPAATHLPDLYYNVSVRADNLNVINEGNESNNYKTKQVSVNHYSGWLWFNDVKADITITDWGTRVADSASEHWITGEGLIDGESFPFTNLKVDKNLTTLDYALDPTENTVINVLFPDRQEVNNVTYWREGGVDLSKNGAYADIKVLFPAGLGVSETSRTIMNATHTFSNLKLKQELYPILATENAAFNVVEESKPVGYTASSMVWNPATGIFSFGRTGIWSARGGHYNSLESKTGQLLDPSMARKKSNAAYYRAVDTLDTNPQVATGVNGEALLSAEISLAPVAMTSHFPYDVAQEWMDPSSITIVNDLIDSSASQLKTPTNMEVSYARDCAGKECAGAAGPATIFTTPNDHTTVSVDGGLWSPVDITGNGNLKWGTRWDSVPAQQTESFADGRFYMPGHFIRGDQSAFETTSMRGPAEILLSGMAGAMERPSLANYADGLADYAGLNLRVGSDAAMDAASVVGGEPSGDWPLTGRSKYYIRASGVSGIHEAYSFPAEMNIYDYPFGFSNYGLSYLSGKPKDSRVNGVVAVKEPCDINMAFENLMLDCLGELEDAELANSDTKTLKYWDAEIQPLSLFFAPTASSTCGTAARKLCMGLTTQCANVDQTLSGVLGFLPTGELGAPADQIEGVPSRLSTPNTVELAGPGDEIYYFNPVANPYYNDHALSGDTMNDRGWINFAGNVDVSFFNDLQVHFQTSASTNSEVANIHMMGGWKQSGKTFFTSDPDAFDTSNAGFPAGTLAYADYRGSKDPEYQVHALRTWLGIVDFDYPLEWSSATKSFKSPSELEEDLLVVEVQHQTDYLSAENTEISFGVQYDGVPQINLANMAFNAVDEATGMMSAFTNAVGEEIHTAVESGMAAFDDTLADLPEMLFDPVFDAVLDPMIDEFYADLHDAYASQPTATDFGTVVTQYLHGVAGPTYANAGTILSSLASSSSSAVNLLGRIDANLADAVNLINAFADVVSATNGVALPENAPGLLAVTGGEYDVLTDLGVGILSVLAETLYDQISASVQAELNAVLSSAAPSLGSITETLLELRDVIEEVREGLDSSASVALELNAALNSPLVQDTLNTISADIMARLNGMSSGGSSFAEYTPEEVKAMLRRQISDAFYGSVPCADAQRVVRARLYEVEAAIQQSIDSAFQQLNKAMKDLISEYVAKLDEEINGALGDLSDVLGAGQIDGYAHIRHDALNELRLDGKFQWKVPDEMEFNAFLVIKDLNSSMPGGCGVDADSLPEVTLGTTDFGLGMLGSDIRADIATKFAFAENGGSLRLIGMGGSFEMTEGQIGFEAFAINELYAAVAFGALENYLSANVRCAFTSYEVEGGVFLGKSCSLDPFSWDPDVQSVLGDPPFTGIYVYGEGWMPIVDYGCLFRVKAGVGAGIFAFVDGPVGGKIFLGADGEALCVVNVAGEVTLVGLKDGDDMRMVGKGKISGRAGSCPFCVKFKKTVTITYDNGNWDADY